MQPRSTSPPPPVSPMFSARSATQYQKESGDGVLFNFGASSLLARQIIEGAPADLFISADELKMDQLQQRGLIVKKSRAKHPLEHARDRRSERQRAEDRLGEGSRRSLDPQRRRRGAAERSRRHLREGVPAQAEGLGPHHVQARFRPTTSVPRSRPSSPAMSRPASSTRPTR